METMVMVAGAQLGVSKIVAATTNMSKRRGLDSDLDASQMPARGTTIKAAKVKYITINRNMGAALGRRCALANMDEASLYFVDLRRQRVRVVKAERN